MNISKNVEWWKSATFYQIWPRSFSDGNGDGIGDIRGIIERLDYLKHLGVDAVWLSPIFKSPNKDQGYDISDYCEVMPEFGTMADVEEMIEKAKERGIRFVFDLVINHSSDQHEWFKKSCQRIAPYTDYYIWKDGLGEDKKGLPNNWGSIFGGPTWTYVPERGQYYFHMFASQQPDLNLDNPVVMEEIGKIIDFWSGKGVAGFRVDAVCHFSKPADFPSYPGNALNVIGDMHFNGPNMHEITRNISALIKKRPDAVMLGELAGIKAVEFDLNCAPERKENDMMITFEHMMVDTDYDKHMGKFKTKPFELDELRKIIGGWYDHMKRGWLATYLCNHDQPRIVSRWGDNGKYRVQSAKMLGLFLHGLRGTPFIYQGEELGMTNWKFKPEEADDVEFRGFYQQLVVDTKMLTEEQFMELAHQRARDTSRTPVHWDDSPFGGFTKGDKTWIGVCDNYAEVNAAASVKDPNSVFNFFRELIKLRKSQDLMVQGDVKIVYKQHPHVMAYTRSWEDASSGEYLLILCNFKNLETEIMLEEGLPGAKVELTVLLSNYVDTLMQDGQLQVRPYEAILYRCRPKTTSATTA